MSPFRLATRYFTQLLTSSLMSLLVLKHDDIVKSFLHCYHFWNSWNFYTTNLTCQCAVTEPVHSGPQLGRQGPAHCWSGAQTAGGLRQARSAQSHTRRPSPSATAHHEEREDAAGEDRLEGVGREGSFV